jgi:hypothetical protein
MSEVMKIIFGLLLAGLFFICLNDVGAQQASPSPSPVQKKKQTAPKKRQEVSPVHRMGFPSLDDLPPEPMVLTPEK